MHLDEEYSKKFRNFVEDADVITSESKMTEMLLRPPPSSQTGRSLTHRAFDDGFSEHHHLGGVPSANMGRGLWTILQPTSRG